MVNNTNTTTQILPELRKPVAISMLLSACAKADIPDTSVIKIDKIIFFMIRVNLQIDLICFPKCVNDTLKCKSKYL